jgi:hypothetical protein
MGLFGGKDWNIIAIIFERRDMYRVNGNRGKGGKATESRDGAKNHTRTILWAVFDQKRAFVEGELGRGAELIPIEVAQKLKRELLTIGTVQETLKVLESGKAPLVAKPLAWVGYPKPEIFGQEG